MRSILLLFQPFRSALIVTLAIFCASAGADHEILLPIQVIVRDQCTTPTCWLHSTVAAMDYLVTAKFGVKEPLSLNYLLMKDLHGRIDLIQQNSHGEEDGLKSIKVMLDEFFKNHALNYQTFIPPWFDCTKLLSSY